MLRIHTATPSHALTVNRVYPETERLNAEPESLEPGQLMTIKEIASDQQSEAEPRKLASPRSQEQPPA